MSTRVYVPSSPRRLHDLLVSGGLGPAPLLAHAVTERLRATFPDAGEEEWEYAALTAAAQDSVGLIAEGERPRRVVVVAETGTATPVADSDDSLVKVGEVIALARVVAVHVDSEDAADAVSSARRVWASAEDGDPAAQEALDRCLDHELGWYATQEIGTLVEER